MFVSRDKQESGAIPAAEFVSLMGDIRGFRMSGYVREHLLSVSLRGGWPDIVGGREGGMCYQTIFFAEGRGEIQIH